MCYYPDVALIDDLRNTTQDMPPSHAASVGEFSDLLGKIIAYVEHGQTFLDAANSDNPQDLADLMGNETPESPSTDTPPDKPGQGPKPAPSPTKA